MAGARDASLTFISDTAGEHGQRSLIYYISHPEVLIDPAVPIPDWGLSPTGLARVEKLLQQPWIETIGAVYSSMERKAVMLGERIAERLRLPLYRLAELDEVDRSSTGYLPPGEHEACVAELFARPQQSVRGWERAIHAQTRIIRAMELIRAEAPRSKSVAVAAHGAIGAFLICNLKGIPVSRAEDQRGLGNYFVIDRATGEILESWWPIDSVKEGERE